MRPQDPTYGDVADSLFESLAAFTDLQERINAGHDAKQALADVYDAYDIADANDVFDRTGHERADGEDGPLSDGRSTPNGVYLLADTPKTLHPLLVEDGSGDRALLHEVLDERGFDLPKRGE